MSVGGHWDRVFGGVLLLHLPQTKHDLIVGEFNNLIQPATHQRPQYITFFLDRRAHPAGNTRCSEEKPNGIPRLRANRRTRLDAGGFDPEQWRRQEALIPKLAVF